MASTGTFTVVVHGTVDSAECIDPDMLYCRTTLVKGHDWSLAVRGGERANTVDVVTQMSERLPGPQAKFTWNTPFEFALESTNVHGWPQLAISLMNEKDAVFAYARCHIPNRSGRHTVRLPLMLPTYSTPQHQLFGSMGGKQELRDVGYLCAADDRLVMTMKRVAGYAYLSFNVAVSGMDALGYD